MWLLVMGTFIVLGTLAFRGSRWSYVTIIGLGLLFFPARVGFHMNPQPCECTLNLPLALFSLTNYKHILLFAIFFLLTSVQVRFYPDLKRVLVASGAVVAMGIYVELAESLTGQGHCRLRDLIPDIAGALVGALVLGAFRRLWAEGPPKSETLP